MAPKIFSIALDNPTRLYFAGDVITGKVILALEEEKVSQGLELKITGEAVVDWVEVGRYASWHGSTRYHNAESYLSTKIVLVGNDTEQDSDITIPAGRHEHAFTFQLPHKLPSSFESTFGSIRYQIEATVKRPWKSDYTTRTIIKVKTLVDLNQYPVYAGPIEATKTKQICCLFCKRGPISMQIKLPRSGYLPGESIPFSIYCNNSSSRPISAILVVLQRNISYLAHGKAKKVKDDLVKLEGPEVNPYQCESYQGQLQLPVVSPSNLGGCKIILINYLIKVILNIPRGINLNKNIPLLIGTIPFANCPPVPNEEPT